MNWILIKKENKQYLGWSNATEQPACGEPDLLEWIDYRINVGTEKDPVYRGQELPDDIETPIIDPDTGEITTPVYIWNGEELIRETMDI